MTIREGDRAIDERRQVPVTVLKIERTYSDGRRRMLPIALVEYANKTQGWLRLQRLEKP